MTDLLRYKYKLELYWYLNPEKPSKKKINFHQYKTECARYGILINRNSIKHHDVYNMIDTTDRTITTQLEKYDELIKALKVELKKQNTNNNNDVDEIERNI